MTEQQRLDLQERVEQWRQRAAHVGPQHSLWDVIADAEALLAGRPTLMQGSKEEVYQALIATT